MQEETYFWGVTPPLRGDIPRVGYFESMGGVAGNQYPQDAVRIKNQWFSSSDQFVHMIMGGEIYLGAPTYTQSWHIGRQLGR